MKLVALKLYSNSACAAPEETGSWCLCCDLVRQPVQVGRRQSV